LIGAVGDAVAVVVECVVAVLWRRHDFVDATAPDSVFAEQQPLGADTNSRSTDGTGVACLGRAVLACAAKLGVALLIRGTLQRRAGDTVSVLAVLRPVAYVAVVLADHVEAWVLRWLAVLGLVTDQAGIFARLAFRAALAVLLAAAGVLSGTAQLVVAIDFAVAVVVLRVVTDFA